ncbi:MAG: hypothetical protein NZ611_06565, partial [Bacteroidia bacterium]|nr:hypothetical protein [Bacteroidia bacterium]
MQVLLAWSTLLQVIVAELALDKRHPRPLRAEYVQSDGGLATISHKTATSTRTFTLHKYDADLRHEWSQDLFEQSSGEELLDLAVIEEQIWVFTQRVEGIKRMVYGYKIDLKGRVLYRQKPIFTAEPFNRTTRPELTYAPNRKYACISLALRMPADSADRIRFYLIGPDTAFGGDWILPYKEREIEIRRAIQPNHEGHLFAIGAIRSADQPYPQYFLLRYIPEARLTLSIPLETEGVYLIEPTFRLEKGGGARLAAFYSVQRRSTQVQGLVFAKVEGDGFFLSNIQQTPLPPEVLQRFLAHVPPVEVGTLLAGDGVAVEIVGVDPIPLLEGPGD